MATTSNDESPCFPKSFTTPIEQSIIHRDFEIEHLEEQIFVKKKLIAIIESVSTQNETLLKQTTKEILANLQLTEHKLETKQQQKTKAEKIANKYRTSLQLPNYLPPPESYQCTPERTSPTSILEAVGKFNPLDPNANFKRTWSKLLIFGQSHFYKEKEYLYALTIITEGTAYDTIETLIENDQTLPNIIDYFAKVFTKKRSLMEDQLQIDQFSRRPNEPLDVCMYRSLILIERLQHLHSEQAWPEIRDHMRKQILMKSVSKDIMTQIQLDETTATQETGLHVTIDQLIESATKKEWAADLIPTKDKPDPPNQTLETLPTNAIQTRRPRSLSAIDFRRPHCKNCMCFKDFPKTSKLRWKQLAPQKCNSANINDLIKQHPEQKRINKALSSFSSEHIANLPDLQCTDEYFGKIYNNIEHYSSFNINKNILFKQENHVQKQVLPSICLKDLVKKLHNDFEKYHLSKTHIRKAIQKLYFINNGAFSKIIQEITKPCDLCNENTNK